MTHVSTHESLETTPPRTPACTLEEARKLLAELKAEYDALSPAERMAVRQALEEAAAESSMGQPSGAVKRSMISLPATRAYWWHVASGLGRLGLLVLNFICDPITVLPAIVSGLWKLKLTPKERENHATN